MTSREDEIVSSFLSMAGGLVQGDEVADLLGRLTTDCARLLDVVSAGLLLADQRGALHVVAASSDRAADLEALQSREQQGPCHDCFRSGQPVHVPDVAAERDRWPEFVPAALAAGVASVHAVPLRLREQVLGGLGLFGGSPGPLNEPDLRLAQALADVATIAVILDRAAADQSAVNEQLQLALTSRILLEQAKGLLAYAGGLDMASAYATLRQYARDHNLKLTPLTQSLVDQSLPVQVVLEHARARAQTGQA